MTQTIEVEAIQRLMIKPNEVLVVTVPEADYSPEVAYQIAGVFEHALDVRGGKVIVMPASIELTVAEAE